MVFVRLYTGVITVTPGIKVILNHYLCSYENAIFKINRTQITKNKEV